MSAICDSVTMEFMFICSTNTSQCPNGLDSLLLIKHSHYKSIRHPTDITNKTKCFRAVARQNVFVLAAWTQSIDDMWFTCSHLTVLIEHPSVKYFAIFDKNG